MTISTMIRSLARGFQTSGKGRQTVSPVFPNFHRPRGPDNVWDWQFSCMTKGV